MLRPQAEVKATRLLIIVIAVLHAALALLFKVLFFSYYVIDKIGADISIPGMNDTSPTTSALKATASVTASLMSL